MATGCRAFSGATLVLIFRAILYEAHQSALELNRNLPPALERIINKALEKNRAVRYQSAREMLADLKRLKREINSGRACVGARLGPPTGAEAGGSIARPLPQGGEGCGPNNRITAPTHRRRGVTYFGCPDSALSGAPIRTRTLAVASNGMRAAAKKAGL